MTNIDMKTFVDIVKEYNISPKIIMEIGSLNGNDSIYFKSCFPESTVIAIEGLYDNYETYMKNIPDVECYNVIINEYNGECIYHKKNVNGLHGIYDRGSEYGTSVITSPCMRLDTFCETIKISNIDMMKIDVEGATIEILKSMGEILSTVKILHIETEDFPYFKGQQLHDFVFNYLKQSGFINVLTTSAQIDSNGKQYDSVWVKK